MMQKFIAFIALVCISLSMNLNAETKVLAFAGSTAKQSINKKLITLAAEIARQKGAAVTFADLNDYPIPFYNADLEAKEGMPEKARQFRQLMIDSDVILISSPEYNHSFPALLKNSLDWASRSGTGTSSRAAFQGKLFGLMSTSPSKEGGANGLNHLQDVVSAIKGVVFPKKFTLPNGYTAFDKEGRLVDQNKHKELESFIQEILSTTNNGGV